MKKSSFTIALISLIALNGLLGQESLNVGVEAGFTKDIYELSDQGNSLNNHSPMGVTWGIKIDQEINNYLAFETGIMIKEYNEGFGFKELEYIKGTYSNAMFTTQIPILINYNLNLYQDKVNFLTKIGAHYCINHNYTSYGRSWGYTYSQNDSISYNYTSNPGLKKDFLLLATGGGFEFTLFKRVNLLLFTTYFTGFQKKIQLDINYQVNGKNNSAKAHSNGDYWVVGLSLRYKFKDIWTKEEKK